MLKRTQTKQYNFYIEVKTTMCEMKNTLDRIYSRLDIAEESISEFEHMVISKVK